MADGYRRRLVVFVKAPVLGGVKTRLARDIGMSEATRWYRATANGLIRRLASDPRWHTLLAVSPDRALLQHFWPVHVPRMAQGPGDLGARMSRVFRALPPGPAVIIGSDIPGVTPGHIAAAFRALDSSDVVLGPATDGGYWLIGVRRCPVALPLARDIRWSTPHALADTVDQLKDFSIAYVDTLHDVDTSADLQVQFSRRPLIPPPSR